MHPRRSRRRSRPPALPLALVLLSAGLRPEARGEGSLAYTYEDYDETGGRVGVHTQGLAAGQDLGPDTRLGVTLLNDAIAGASPTGVPAPAGSSQVPLAYLSDHRKAWEADLTRRFGAVSVAAGASGSREHDYVSRGWSLNTLADFNQKNTTLLAGIAGHDDQVETFFDPQHAYVGKQAFSAIMGVTQLLDPLTTVTLDFTWARETGFLNDQYKVVQKTEELVPGSFFPLVFAENRPGARDSGTAFASVNRAFPAARGALEASARFYADTYGVAAGTAELRWIQKVGRRLAVAPEVRYHQQGAARFYYYNLDATDLTPTVVPNPRGPDYSSDYRLSSLQAATCGLKVTWKPDERLQLDVAYDRYAMRGHDGVTPQSAYPVANILSAGAKLSW